MSAATSLPVRRSSPPHRRMSVGAARKRRGLVSRISIVEWRVIALAIFLVVWHLASIPAGKLLLPSPLDVVPAFFDELRSSASC